jgi:hypothetical protein
MHTADMQATPMMMPRFQAEQYSFNAVNDHRAIASCFDAIWDGIFVYQSITEHTTPVARPLPQQNRARLLTILAFNLSRQQHHLKLVHRKDPLVPLHVLLIPATRFADHLGFARFDQDQCHQHT